MLSHMAGFKKGLFLKWGGVCLHRLCLTAKKEGVRQVRMCEAQELKTVLVPHWPSLAFTSRTSFACEFQFPCAEMRSTIATSQGYCQNQMRELT